MSFNYIGVVGEKEEASLSVTLRERDSQTPLGEFGLNDLKTRFEQETLKNSDSGLNGGFKEYRKKTT